MNANPHRPERKTTDRPGATRYSKQIQAISASIADACDGFTDEQVAEALGAAEFLYHLLKGETIIRERKAKGVKRDDK